VNIRKIKQQIKKEESNYEKIMCYFTGDCHDDGIWFR
jgi:hypothetical protein